MVDFDSEFEAASIATTRAIFAAEFAVGFSNWTKLPSDLTRVCIEAWLKLGPRANLAHDQQLAQNFREMGCESLLPAELRSIQSFAEFEEWRSIALEIKMAGFSYFVEEVRTSKGKADDGEAKRAIEESVRGKRIGFESGIAPLLSTKSGCAVYLQVTQRRRVVDAQMMCCPKGVAPVLANHRGLHGIVTECKVDVLMNSSAEVEIVANEIARHVEMMREKLS